MRITIDQIKTMKQKGERIAMVTTYDYSTAKIVDAVGIPLVLVGDSLCRVRNTPSQSGFGLAQREINVRNAFGVKEPVTISGKRLVLVDDVLTTGATADACVGALLEAGAEEVCVLTVARTPEPGISP